MAVHASGSALHAFPGVGASHFGVSGTGLSSRWGIQTRPRSAQLLHAVFVGVIRFSLDVALYDNAQFFGERMVAHFPGDDEALFLLALSHARRARHPTVLALLRSTSYPQSKYLLAQSCRAVGRLQEAEMHMQDVAAVASDFSGPNAGLVRSEPTFRADLEKSAIMCQQAFICMDANRTDQAKEYFEASLDSNPFLWSSIQALCQMGTDIEVDAILDVSKAIQFLKSVPGLIPPHLLQHGAADASTAPVASSSRAPPVPAATHGHASAAGRENDASRGDLSNVLQPARPRTAFTYGLRPHNGQDTLAIRTNNVAAPQIQPPAAPASRSHSASSTSRGNSETGEAVVPVSQPESSQVKSSQTTKTKRTTAVVETKPTVATRKTKVATDAVSTSSAGSSVQTRRSTRAVGTGTGATRATEASTAASRTKRTTKATTPLETNGKAALKHAADGDVNMEDAASVASGMTPITPSADSVDWTLLEPAVESLFGVLRTLATGYNHLCQYRCKEAFDSFSGAPPEHYATGWVLCQAAKAQFEMAEYRRCEQLFCQAREVEPHRVDDMEVFSVALWHMHKEVELSHLAHDLVEFDKKRPQAWCAVGNTFSLKQEHDSALKCFQRAIQLDSQFAYAYTLAGHEYIANEDLDKAQSCFRSALRVDERHYNAWYGLGYLFYRQEKLQMAKFHFESALMINKASPILTYYIGMVLQHTERKEEALQKYEEALAMAPKNPLFRFAKAEVLYSLKQYPEALEELQILAGYTQEPNVYFLMGKVYKTLGDSRNALLAFTKSDSKSSKSSVTIKDQIERLQEEAEEMSP